MTQRNVKEVLVLIFYSELRIPALKELLSHVCRTERSAENPEICCMMPLHYSADPQ